MPQWSNSRLRVFHGTDAAAANALTGATPVAINLALCAPFTDFGQGFYVTTWEHQAQQWANTRSLKVGRPAAVIAFDLDRDWLASLDTLAFVRATGDFWDLVADCRHGHPPHQRRPPHPVPYDVVHGPVSLWPQRLLIADCDQISFHTTRAITGLGMPQMMPGPTTATGLFP